MYFSGVFACVGISRDSWHKRRSTGGKRAPIRKKRKFELGRPPAGTKVHSCKRITWYLINTPSQIGSKRIHLVRTRGGNTKHRAMRLDNGNYSWGSEGTYLMHTIGIKPYCLSSRFKKMSCPGCCVQCQQ